MLSINWFYFNWSNYVSKKKTFFSWARVRCILLFKFNCVLLCIWHTPFFTIYLLTKYSEHERDFFFAIFAIFHTSILFLILWLLRYAIYIHTVFDGEFSPNIEVRVHIFNIKIAEQNKHVKTILLLRKENTHLLWQTQNLIKSDYNWHGYAHGLFLCEPFQCALFKPTSSHIISSSLTWSSYYTSYKNIIIRY